MLELGYLKIKKMNPQAKIQLDFRLYRRPFCQPLTTHHGTWKVREGIILRLTDIAGNIGWGEIAPLPWFGSETLEAALEFCQSLGGQLTEETILAISAALPACQFGFESAWETLSGKAERQIGKRLNYCYLLPTGEAAITAGKNYQDAGTFKWKIGILSPEVEMAIFEKLAQVLPAGSKIRLDANGGLAEAEAEAWLALSDSAGIVEFIEQPMPAAAFSQMLALSRVFTTPIALDESVATLQQLGECYQRGWREIFVIKPAIAGSPQRLRQFCRQYPVDLVFSSVFETKIGREAALRLAAELISEKRAVGFGINYWFTEEEEGWLAALWKDF
jgi:O-succinylbenzoate synthase